MKSGHLLKNYQKYFNRNEKMLNITGFSDISVKLRPESREFIKERVPGSGAEEYVFLAVIPVCKKNMK